MNEENALLERASELLRHGQLTLAVAESCTGGMLGGWLTGIPGSSAFFLGGVISYADSVKISLLGVPPDLIVEHGAVSAECALSMAHGVLSLTGADIALAITGVAGPGGGTEAKPVGTTFVALVGSGVEHAVKRNWEGDRNSNRRESARLALAMVVEHLSGLED
ncbi:MAG: CinA family protein [Chloroflexota bacterium]